MIHPRFYFSTFRPCAPFFYTRQPSPALQHPFHHHSRIASVVHFLACAHKTILGPECLALAVSFGKAQPGTPQTLPFQKQRHSSMIAVPVPFPWLAESTMKRPMNAVSSLGYLRIRSITAVSILPSKIQRKIYLLRFSPAAELSYPPGCFPTLHTADNICKIWDFPPKGGTLRRHRCHTAFWRHTSKITRRAPSFPLLSHLWLHAAPAGKQAGPPQMRRPCLYPSVQLFPVLRRYAM